MESEYYYQNDKSSNLGARKAPWIQTAADNCILFAVHCDARTLVSDTEGNERMAHCEPFILFGIRPAILREFATSPAYLVYEENLPTKPVLRQERQIEAASPILSRAASGSHL